MAGDSILEAGGHANPKTWREESGGVRGGGREIEWAHARGRERERERERALAPPFICFSSTWACPMKIWLSQECCLFYLKSSLWSWDLFLVLFSRACLLATAILDSFSLFYLPNSNPLQHSCLENPITRGVWWATNSPWGQKRRTLHTS